MIAPEHRLTALKTKIINFLKEYCVYSNAQNIKQLTAMKN